MSSMYKQLSDFAWANRRLAWQRQATFAAGTIFVVLNVDAFLAMTCFSLCMLAEYYELQICKKALNISPEDTSGIETAVKKLTRSGILGAAAIVFYISAVAVAEGPSTHIGPLFFLLMASLYTAMNALSVATSHGCKTGCFLNWVSVYSGLRRSNRLAEPKRKFILTTGRHGIRALFRDRVCT